MPLSTSARTLIAAFAIAGVAAIPLGAQTAPAVDDSRCDSLPPYGSRTDTVVASVKIEPEDALPDGWDEILLDGFAQFLRLPATGAVPVYSDAAALSDGKLLTSLVIDGEVSAQLERNGALGKPAITASTLSPGIDSSLVAALDSLESAHVLPPLPKEAKDGPIMVRFEIGQYTPRDQRSKPIAIVTHSTWILDNFVSSLPGNPHPRYPVNAERKRIPGGVLVSFVVGPDGRAIFSTARVLKGGRYRDFQVAVLEVLPQMRFDPARIAGCPVAQLVQMPFAFTIPR
ncbi:MAG TPA: energy transducer TonB [Gemmatimonadaceae bacterium]|nr:energy transducer TonB [Gemmatimonadaceae bacterium]